MISGQMISFSTRRIIRQIKCYMNNISLNFCFFLLCFWRVFKGEKKKGKCFFYSSTMKSPHNFFNESSLDFMNFSFWFPIFLMFLFLKIELKSSVFVPFCFLIWMFFFLIWNELWWFLFGFWFWILDKPPHVTIINIQGEIKNWIKKMMKIRVVMRNEIFFFTFKNFPLFKNGYSSSMNYLLIYVSLLIVFPSSTGLKSLFLIWWNLIRNFFEVMSFCQDAIFGKWLCNLSLRNLMLKNSWLLIEEEILIELIISLNPQRMVLFILFKKKRIHF